MAPNALQGCGEVEKLKQNFLRLLVHKEYKEASNLLRLLTGEHLRAPLDPKRLTNKNTDPKLSAEKCYRYFPLRMYSSAQASHEHPYMGAQSPQSV